jgi:CDP-glycerol glycerophosphotransferase (TagB/SpsB family)
VIFLPNANKSLNCILKKYDFDFKNEPILELVLGRILYENSKNTDKLWSINKVSIIKMFLILLLPIITKVIYQKKYDNIIKSQRSDKVYLFASRTRTDVDFDNIFPVLKEVDSNKNKTILFIKNEIYEKKKEKIQKLNDCSVIFFENSLRKLKMKDAVKGFFNSIKLYKYFIKNINKDFVKEIEKNYKYRIIFAIEEILLFTASFEKELINKNIKLFFSVGHRNFSNFCNKHKIRNILIQHGIIGDATMNPTFSPHFSTNIIVWGENLKQRILKYYPEYEKTNKILALGSPRYDKVIENFVQKKRKKHFYEKLNIYPNKKNVVFFSQTHALHHERLNGDLYVFSPIKALDYLYERMNKDINLIIKLHPYEKTEHYEKYMKNINHVTIIKDEVSLYELLQYTDISISVTSTTLLESMIFEIPTLQLVLVKNLYGIADYYKHNASMLIENKDDLVDIIAKIVDDTIDLSEFKQSQKAYLEQNLANVGTASKKITDYLLRQ